MLKISIVVPSYNQAGFLARTLDSIFGQSPQPYEVIVVDGASKDGTVRLLEDYAARYAALKWISEPDNGPADAVNKGLARVTGDIIGIQSSDDVYYPGAFSEVISAFESNPECGFIYGDIDTIDLEDNVQGTRRYHSFSWAAYFGISTCLPQSSIFFKRELAEEAGNWNSEFYGCDLDYWMRLVFRTQAIHVPRVLSGWRRYEDQRTRQDAYQRIWNDYWRMIDNSPDIAMSPPGVKRLAKASRHLLALRYSPDPSFFFVLRHVLLGACQHPGFWRYNPRGILFGWLPGFALAKSVYFQIRKALGRIPANRKAPVCVARD